MTDTVRASSVVTAIAGLSITVTNARGSSVALKIKDDSAIPQAVSGFECPILAPKPDNFITNGIITRDTTGGDSAYKTIVYQLNYILYFAPVEEGTTLFSSYSALVDAWAVIVASLANNTNNISGETDILPLPVQYFGQVADLAGTKFHGCEISFAVKQYLEV